MLLSPVDGMPKDWAKSVGLRVALTELKIMYTIIATDIHIPTDFQGVEEDWIPLDSWVGFDIEIPFPKLVFE